MRTPSLLATLFFLIGSFAAQADTVSVTWAYNSPTNPLSILAYNGTTALPAADNSGHAGTGFALELGFYSQATAANPFAGNWVPVFGKGDANSLFANASLGDGRATTNATDARFDLTGTVDTTVPGTAVNLPASGQIMAIRYYNSAQSASATYYGAASNASWKWVSPATVPPVPLSFNISQGGTVFQGAVSGAETNQRTSNQLPQITAQPSNTSGTLGSSTSFSVTATGPGLSYQWYFDNTAIPGATASSYNVQVDNSNAGTYDVVVTDVYGDAVTSGTYTLTVLNSTITATDSPTMPVAADLLLAAALVVLVYRRRFFDSATNASR